MNVRRKSFGNRDFLDDTADTAGGQMAATLIDQQCRGISLAAQQALAHSQVLSERHSDRFTKRNVALLFSLAANENGFRTQTYVIEIYTGELRITDAAAIQQLEYQTIALRK